MEELGEERPEWELAAGRLAHAVARQPESFEPKHRWAMDWYYPVLCGAVSGEPARDLLAEPLGRFRHRRRGVRCVSDRPWITAAETAECALAYDAIGDRDRARGLLDSTRYLRDDDGSYWTGVVLPQEVNYPGGERSTYTAAAVLLADAALKRTPRRPPLQAATTAPVLRHRRPARRRSLEASRGLWSGVLPRSSSPLSHGFASTRRLPVRGHLDVAVVVEGVAVELVGRAAAVGGIGEDVVDREPAAAAMWGVQPW